MLTIEVKPKAKDQEFAFKDLEMYHKDCYGGKLEIISSQYYFRSPADAEYLNFYELTCTRCGLKVVVKEQSEVPAKIINTAIDGQKREVKGFKLTEADPRNVDSIEDAVDITVIQKA